MPRSRRPGVLAAVLLAGLGLLAARNAAAEGEPKIRSVNPAWGYRGSTVDVAIEGQNLHPYDELKCTRTDLSMTVLPGSTATKVGVRFQIPDGAEAGPVKLTLRTKAGVVSTEKFQVRMRSPVVSRVVPDSVTRGGEHVLALTGTWLAFQGRDTTVTVPAPLTVKLEGKPTDKSLSLRVTIPPNAPTGPTPITVETIDGKFTATVVVRFAVPAVSGIKPAEVARGVATDVLVSGKFLAGAGPVLLAIPDDRIEIAGRGPATPDGVPLKVTVKSDAPLGPRTLIVQTPDGLATVRLVVAGIPPKVTRVQPAGVPRGATSRVEFKVENAPGEFTVRVVPEDPSVAVTKEKDGHLTVVVSKDAAPGPRTLVVAHPFGLATATLLVNLKGPTITGLSGQVEPGKDSEITIEGQDLEGATARLVVDDPEVRLEPGPRPLVFKVTAAAGTASGPRPILVRTRDGAAIAVLVIGGACASPPSVTRISTTTAPRGTSTEVRLEGVYLRDAGDKPPAVSVVADGPAIPVEIVSSAASTLVVRLTPPVDAAPGGAAILVRTSAGIAAGAVTVIQALPSLESATPAALPRTGAATVAVTGRHLAGSTVVVVRADGSGALPVVVGEAKADRVAATVTLTPTTPAGPYLLVATTKDGGAAAVLTVEPSVPVVDSVEPAVLGVPASAVLTIRGKNLTGASGAAPEVTVTRIGGSAAIRPQLVSAKPDAIEVRLITLPGTPAAPHVLVVKTPDGSAGGVFQVVAVAQPTFTSIEPAEGTRGEGLVVTIRGLALAGMTSLTFSGTGVTAAVLPGGTDSEVKARVAVAADAPPGARKPTISTPGGTVTLESASFTVR